jgi:hypothetical protein
MWCNQSTWNNDSLEGGKLFKVTANDFAFLNELPFELLSTATPKVVGEYSLRAMMDAAFLKMGIYDDFATDILYYFLHNINWFETTIPVLDRVNTDMLYLTLTADSNFTELNEDQTQNTINYIEVLKTICIIFGCRLIQSNGRFWAIQMSNYANVTSDFWQRGIDLNNNSKETISPRVAVDNTSGPLRILEGGSYTAIRPFYSVYAEKPRLNSLVFDNQKDAQSGTAMSATNSAINFTGGNANRLEINFTSDSYTYFNGAVGFTDGVHVHSSGVGFVRIPANNFTYTQQYFEVRVKTSGGVFYWLEKIAGVLTWTTNAAAFVSLEYPLTGPFDGVLQGTLITPVLPSFLIVEVYVFTNPYFKGYAPNGTTFVEGIGNFKGEVICLFLENGTEGDTTVYRSVISPKPFDPTEKQLDTVYLYDNSEGSVKGLMYVNSGANPITQNWVIGASIGSPYNILELAVLNALAQNRAVKEIITATIKGNYYPHQLITYDGKEWHLKQATYNAGLNQWNGEWWELQYDETSITTTANTSNGEWTDTVLIG